MSKIEIRDTHTSRSAAQICNNFETSTIYLTYRKFIAGSSCILDSSWTKIIEEPSVARRLDLRGKSQFSGILKGVSIYGCSKY